MLAMVLLVGGWEMPITAERRRAKELSPALLIPRPSGRVRVDRTKPYKGRIRVWVDADYARGLANWRRTATDLVGRANKFIQPAFNAELEIVDARRWEHEGHAEETDAALAALRALDAGEDVDWVVGLVGPAASATIDTHGAGHAYTFSKHMVMRSLVSPAEVAAFRKGFEVLDEEEQEQLYLARKAHKEVVIFLHEWAHTLGSFHSRERYWIMAPAYHHHAVGFTYEDTRVIEIALFHRLGPNPDRVAEAKGLLDFTSREAGSAEWSEHDRKAIRDTLAALSKGSRLSGEPGAARGLPADVIATYNRSIELFNAGTHDAAWELVAPLATQYSDNGMIQSHACRLLAKVGRLRAERSCRRAAELAERNHEPAMLLDVADAWLRANEMVEAGATVARVAPLARDAEMPIRVRWIVSQAETGALDEAEAMARLLVSPPAQTDAALERIAVLRNRAGIPPGASDEVEPTGPYRAFFVLARSLEHGKVDGMAAEIERARKRWKTPGFDALACELHARQGNAVLLRSTCQHALKVWERTARAHYWLAYLAQETRNPAEAEKRYRRAIELDPESSAAWLGLAGMLRKQGRHVDLPELDTAYSLRFGRSMPLH